MNALEERRRFLQGSGAAALLATLGGARLAFAAAPTENRLVFILLRGGLDALHALPPYADAAYRTLRPRLALGAPGTEGGALALDGYFGLHPALAPIHPLYAAKELLFIPAAATRYRRRAHFDGQNMLENGSAKPFGARDGWLNRALASLGAGARPGGLSIGPTVPLILQGEARVRTWSAGSLPKADDDFLRQLAVIYEGDPLFARALAVARGATAPTLAGMTDTPARNRSFVTAARASAELLSAAQGPRVAVMESNGWDTHFAQERRLSNLLGELAQVLLALRDGLGAHWTRTAVIVVSEFGRTVAENASQGTDHGVGGLAMLAGGAVHGGRIVGHWPGLSAGALHEGRDLRPTSHYESIFKAALTTCLGIGERALEETVFPQSREARPMEGLFRTA